LRDLPSRAPAHGVTSGLAQPSSRLVGGCRCKVRLASFLVARWAKVAGAAVVAARCDRGQR
jgi:hypothetical protein